ncbi:MAG: ABC transporter permease [Acidimicrobiia bacterium]
MSARAIAAQSRMELALTLRRGESLVVTLFIPVGVLVLFSKITPVKTTSADALDFLVPGVLALAVIATSMVSLGIATGFERRYNVLKRLGATPLSRRGLLIAKSCNVLAIEALQVAVIVVVAVALGWHLTWRIIPAVAVLAVGSVAFSGLGLLFAGTLRAEATLAIVNLLYLLFIGLGGIAYPLKDLPNAVSAVAEALPAAALAQSVRAVLEPGPGTLGGPLAVLVVWAAVTPFLASRYFRWEE